MLEALVVIIGVILIIALVVGLQGLIYWGMGAFICWAFAIPFTFTFVHGVALAFIVSILGGIFKTTVIKKND